MNRAAGRDAESVRGWVRARTVLGFVAGAALLGAAVWAVTSRTDALGPAIEAARRAPAVLVALALVLPVLNWLLTSAVFGTLTRRYGAVGAGEMAALIGAAGLLNYLPLRPGLFGRIAYHKAVNGIAVADCVRVVALNIACCGAALAAGLGAAFASDALSGQQRGLSLAVLAGPAILAALAAWPLAMLRPAAVPLLLAGSVRYADLLVWSLRYALVFQIVGSPVSPAAAVALACVAQAAMLVPLAGNGLGLREWAIGLTAGLLPAGAVASGGAATGLTADLFNRASELVVAVPIGLWSAAWLARRLRRVTGTGDSAPPPVNA